MQASWQGHEKLMLQTRTEGRGESRMPLPSSLARLVCLPHRPKKILHRSLSVSPSKPSGLLSLPVIEHLMVCNDIQVLEICDQIGDLYILRRVRDFPSTK